jgi:hypothetical protein
MMQRMMIAVMLAITSAAFAGTTECAPQQTAKLTSYAWSDYDDFGSSVAIDAGVAVIGAPGDDDSGPNTGRAHFFEKQADGT